MSSSKHVLNWTSIMVAIPVGCAASLVTLGFRHLIALINQLLFHSDRDITVAITAWPWFFWPLLVGAGGVIAGFFLRYATSLERQQTSKTDYLDVINARLDAVPTKTSLFRALSSIASIGSGASVGKEGPMVQLSALCGSAIGRLLPASLNLKNSDVVAMAAAAGLASVYHAPLASAIFVAEIAFGITALQRLIPLIIAAATAVMTMWSLGYRNALYPFAEVQFQLSPTTLLLTVAIGLLAGLLVRYWVTQPVKRLTAEVSGLEQDSISAIKQLADQPLENSTGDEVTLLRNTFIELARKITSQWDQLADSDRQRREFIANISHDLRTPLTSLLGYLETLSMKSATLTAEESQKYLATALRQGQKVRHLSQQLFELARLEYGGIKPQRERFAMGELISDVAQKFELTAQTRELRLHIDVPGRLPLVNADVSMIERVVTNLLDNAMRHTPAGGDIRLAVWQENQQLQVEVTDSGPGIAAALRDDLFLRPSALGQQASRENRGGLGLLIVKRMLELHGGGINLMEAATGARFRFYVPL